MEETVETVNASDIFDAIELGDFEKQEFLDHIFCNGLQLLDR